MTLRILIFMLACYGALGSQFTEFYMEHAGTNVNSGSGPGTNLTFFEASGNWTNSTSTWFKSGADVSAVLPNMFASVCSDTATQAAFVARVLYASNSTIILSTTNSMGTSPANLTNVCSLRVGGAWYGSIGNNNFPLNAINSSLVSTNTVGDRNEFRLNVKADSTYTLRAAVVLSSSLSQATIQGYSSSVGDGGRAEFNGGSSGSSYTVFTVQTAGIKFIDLIFNGNGASGSNPLLTTSGKNCLFFRCTFKNGVNVGVIDSANSLFVSCDMVSNSAAGLNIASSTAIRCIASWNKNSGFYCNAGNARLHNCISANNSQNGIELFGNTASTVISGCDVYSNQLSGIDIGSGTVNSGITYIENCNIFRNGRGGLTNSGTGGRIGYMSYSVFGSGTQTNTGGGFPPTFWTSSTTVSNAFTTNMITTYAVGQTPWVDPDHLNFTMSTNATTRGTGLMSFTQDGVNSPTNTVGYVDIGAALSASTNSTTFTNTVHAAETSHVFVQ